MAVSAAPLRDSSGQCGAKTGPSPAAIGPVLSGWKVGLEVSGCYRATPVASGATGVGDTCIGPGASSCFDRCIPGGGGLGQDRVPGWDSLGLGARSGKGQECKQRGWGNWWGGHWWPRGGGRGEHVPGGGSRVCLGLDRVDPSVCLGQWAGKHTRLYSQEDIPCLWGTRVGTPAEPQAPGHPSPV